MLRGWFCSGSVVVWFEGCDLWVICGWFDGLRVVRWSEGGLRMVRGWFEGCSRLVRGFEGRCGSKMV